MDTPENQPTIIFLHILKTGGTTFNIILENYFSKERSFSTFPNRMHPDGSIDGFKSLSMDERAKIDLLNGHMGFGLHELLPRPATYLTLLRDPVDRVISHYYHAVREKGAVLHDKIQSREIDLSGHIRYYAEAADMDNLQTRMIAGNWELRGFGPCTEEMLETAKRNLREHFAVVGITEQFDAFYLLAADLFNWEVLPYQRWEVAKKRARKSDLSPEELYTLETYNKFDLELYQYAKSLFREQIQQKGSFFPLSVWLYSLANRHPGLYWGVRRFSLRVWLHTHVKQV
jgi:hypothetical protein